MPSFGSSVISTERASSTVIVPSLPTLSIAEAIILPITLSELAEIVAICSISLFSLTARASCSTPARTCARACSLKSNCFAAMLTPIVHGRSPHGSGQRRLSGLLLDENPEHVILAEDDVLDPIDLHLGAAVLADEDAVALLDLHGDPLAVLGHATGADGEHLTLLRLLLRGVGDDDAALRRLLFLDATNQNAVGKRLDVHASSSGACVAAPSTWNQTLGSSVRSPGKPGGAWTGDGVAWSRGRLPVAGAL